MRQDAEFVSRDMDTPECPRILGYPREPTAAQASCRQSWEENPHCSSNSRSSLTDPLRLTSTQCSRLWTSLRGGAEAAARHTAGRASCGSDLCSLRSSHRMTCGNSMYVAPVSSHTRSSSRKQATHTSSNAASAWHMDGAAAQAEHGKQQAGGQAPVKSYPPTPPQHCCAPDTPVAHPLCAPRSDSASRARKARPDAVLGTRLSCRRSSASARQPGLSACTASS